VVRSAKATVRDILAKAALMENDGIRAEMAQHALQSEAAARIKAIVSLAESEKPIAVAPDAFDADPWLLNVANGTIDLRTGQLRPHQRGEMITKLAPVVYHPQAECPRWRAFLDRIMAGNTDLISFMQRSVGYALTGVIREHVLHVLYGTGANGKTTFIETLLAALGDYGRQAAPKVLIQRKYEAHPTDIADLRGARFVASCESGERARLDEEKVKMLTGGDRLKGRFMRQDFFEFSPTHKLFLATNHRPVIRGTDMGIWRRIRLWPFAVTIPDEEQDRMLPDKLRTESPGIIRWAVDGCLDWQKQGLGEPTEVRGATAAYREEMDTLGKFIAECCVVGDGAQANSTQLYEAYQKCCERTGQRPVNLTNFGNSLGDRGYDRARNASGRVIRIGIGLLGPHSE
jgi:putative DNA primase/helicase